MKTLFTAIAILICIGINAQWYANQYGVTDMNELNKEQLDLSLQQATKLKKAGVITTVASSAFMVVGFVMYANGLNDITSSSSYSDIDDGAGKAYNGAGLLTVGTIGACVGVPLWIAGAQRENVVRVHLKKFDPVSYNRPAFGVGLTYTF